MQGFRIRWRRNLPAWGRRPNLSHPTITSSLAAPWLLSRVYWPYSRWCVSHPLARFARVSPHEGETNFILPLREGRAAEGGRGWLTHHLELGWAARPAAVAEGGYAKVNIRE